MKKNEYGYLGQVPFESKTEMNDVRNDAFTVIDNSRSNAVNHKTKTNSQVIVVILMIIAMIVITGVFIVLNRISEIRTYCSGILDNSSCVTDDYQSSTQAYYKYDDNRVNIENK